MAHSMRNSDILILSEEKHSVVINHMNKNNRESAGEVLKESLNQETKKAVLHRSIFQNGPCQVHCVSRGSVHD